MILVAIASALATRLTFVVNLVLCLLIYFLGHLAPYLFPDDFSTDKITPADIRPPWIVYE